MFCRVLLYLCYHWSSRSQERKKALGFIAALVHWFAGSKGLTRYCCHCFAAPLLHFNFNFLCRVSFVLCVAALLRCCSRSVVNQLNRLGITEEFTKWSNSHVDFLRQFVDWQSCINQMHTLCLLLREAMKKYYVKEVQGVVTLEALKHCVRFLVFIFHMACKGRWGKWFLFDTGGPP